MSSRGRTLFGVKKGWRFSSPSSILIFHQQGLAWEGRGGGAGGVIFICLSLLRVQMPGWDYSIPSAFRQGHMGTTNSPKPLALGRNRRAGHIPHRASGSLGLHIRGCTQPGAGEGGTECRPPRTHQSPFHKRAGLPSSQARDTCPTRELTLLSTPRCSHRLGAGNLWDGRSPGGGAAPAP